MRTPRLPGPGWALALTISVCMTLGFCGTGPASADVPAGLSGYTYFSSNTSTCWQQAAYPASLLTVCSRDGPADPTNHSSGNWSRPEYVSGQRPGRSVLLIFRRSGALANPSIDGSPLTGFATPSPAGSLHAAPSADVPVGGEPFCQNGPDSTGQGDGLRRSPPFTVSRGVGSVLTKRLAADRNIRRRCQRVRTLRRGRRETGQR